MFSFLTALLLKLNNNNNNNKRQNSRIVEKKKKRRMEEASKVNDNFPKIYTQDTLKDVKTYV